MYQLNKFCYIPFHGFCIDPGGFLSYCCMDTVTGPDQPNKKRVYKTTHIEEIEDLQEWWETTYEPVWETYIKNKQDSINPCYKCFNKNAMKDKRPVKESYDSNLKNGLVKWQFDFIKPKVRVLDATVLAPPSDTNSVSSEICVLTAPPSKDVILFATIVLILLISSPL